MRTRYLLALMAATVIAPSAAFAQGNTVGGAVGGAVVGGVVGGPVGAVVGAGVGGTVGAATEPPEGVVTYVERERSPSVTVRERVVVGQALPETVVIHNVPQHDDYAYAVVNDERVIVEPHSRKVIKVIK
jgi:outer membrane lipoprotein SlyB